MEKRALNASLEKKIGKKAKICGWVNTRRDHGKIVFLDLRDRSGILQVVCNSRLAEKIKEEDVLSIEGKVQKRPAKMMNPDLETGKIELQAEKILILSEADTIPFDFTAKELNLKIPTLLDYRPLTIRNEKIKSIFKIKAEIAEGFRQAFRKMDFTEFQSPNIVPNAAEGGSEIFRIDYYGHNAYLSQSPQLYKQIMLGAFERVFAVATVYRAEPSMTTRHLSEYTSLDAEMAFIESWQELMDCCEKGIREIFSLTEKNCKKELDIHRAKVPKITKEIPKIKMRDAQQIIYKRTKRDHRKEPDLDPEDEKEICRWAEEKYGSELIFITHYPVKKRPFYTFPDPKNENYTLSFDLLFRGLEIVTGGQRINDYEKLSENIKKWGNNIEKFSFYLQAFKYGMPPEGGFAFGAERIVKQLLGLSNVKEASAFPRDMERIDKRLSSNQKKENYGRDKKKKKRKA